MIPINIKAWVAENRHLLKPPVSNKVIFEDEQFLFMAVAGPNNRRDYHYNETAEIFFQVLGDIQVKVQVEGKAQLITIKEGEFFFLPAKTPHSPIRGADTVGLVIEAKRSGAKDGLLWFCEHCNHKLYEEYFVLESIEKDFLPVFKRFYDSEDLRTCKNCQTKMPTV
jgi:3-hydroxyanthranilate 3,4-dioxygenase